MQKMKINFKELIPTKRIQLLKKVSRQINSGLKNPPLLSIKEEEKILDSYIDSEKRS